MRLDILSLDPIYRSQESWRLSRDLTRDVPAAEVAMVDVPVNEMPSAVIHCDRFTILERELFASPRNHVMWARTSHVDDAADFDWPDDADADASFMEDQRQKMRVAKARGLSQDEYRFDMPVLALTSWTQRISFRDAVKMLKYVEYLRSKVASGLTTRVDKIHSSLSHLVAEFLNGDVDLALRAVDSFLLAKYLHEGEVNGAGPTVESQNYLCLPMRQPLWMRAQIVRHRSLGVVDNFYSKVLTAKDYATKTIDEPIDMELSAAKDFWQSILGKRTCWLAQDTLAKRKDLWQEIVDRFGFRPDMLPCASGHCPYSGDAALRLTDADPGCPCPRYMNIEKIDKAEYVADMRVAAKSRHPYWFGEISAKTREVA